MKSKATNRVMGTAMRVASSNNGNDGDGVKSNGEVNKGGRKATATRVMVAVTTMVGSNEGDGNGNEVDWQ